ncbi:MAG: hypothetical protein DWH80_00435 [Planctomycetota bacterium]|nr:MAG: hypothetical protein DWH80_00435 [Planctomycetota bacterium]
MFLLPSGACKQRFIGVIPRISFPHCIRGHSLSCVMLRSTSNFFCARLESSVDGMNNTVFEVNTRGVE